MSTLALVFLVILLLLLFGSLPTWGHSRSWGWAPTGILGVMVIVLVVLLLTGHVRL